MREDLKKAASVNGKISLWMNKGSLKEVDALLNPEEKVIHAELVNFAETPGVFVVTDKRVVAVSYTLGDVSVKQIRHENISRVAKAGGQVVGAPSMVIESPLDSIMINTIHRKRASEVQRTLTNLIS